MSHLGNFRLKFVKAIAIFEFSAMGFVIMPKFVQNKKTLNSGPKMPYLGVFYFVIFEITALKFVRNEYLANAVHFDTWSAFSEGLGPVQSNKVCRPLLVSVR